jgi:radical SAM family uncharacterized protein/radical SAM-linked protein
MNKVDISSLLNQVSKPTRYLGNEINSIHKDLSKVALKVALAFPDVYEVGMSHLGLRILYQILNDLEDVAAERVYAPWIDADEVMRKHNIPLFSLESRIPVKEFDILGFSLQYELSYTNILNMLDLAHIPLLSSSRNHYQFPLVIAGGPLSFNPEPLVDFIDLFCIGDGEELILELITTYKQNRHKSKSELLIILSQIKGIYAPLLYDVEYHNDGRIKKFSTKIKAVPEKIQKRIVTNLDKATFPSKQIIPFMEIIHDRASLEIQRGCSFGCRFCHAGMVYRPVRERSVSCLLNQAYETISKTGYEELSLGSLSTTDYSYILNLVSCLHAQFGNCVSLSLPSLRIDPLIPEISSILAKIKPTGLTLVPEVGTEKLQKVINKTVNINELVAAIKNVFRLGWRSVKLYFMIGLPKEDYTDLDGIIEIIHKLKGLSKGKQKIKVSLSSFVPKPHTPFQWTAQLPKDELFARQFYILNRLHMKNIEFSWHDINLSFLEAVFSKGDRRLGKVLLKAFELGCKFDAWNEYFNFDNWQQAFNITNIDPTFYANRNINFDEILPWEHIDTGINKEFLWQEYQKALNLQQTQNCRQTQKCNKCGLEKECSYQSREYRVESRECRVESKEYKAQMSGTKMRVRIKFTKEREMKYISHLDLIRLLQRAIRRADIPIAMTQGFSPHPKLSLSQPLSVGISSQAEYADLSLYRHIKLDKLISLLNQTLPEGIKVLEAIFIPTKPKSLTALINCLLYKIEIKDEDISSRINEFLNKESVCIFRVVNGRKREINIRKFIDRIILNKRELLVYFKVDNGKTIKIQEFLNAISLNDENIVNIIRLGQFYKDNSGRLFSPMEIR